MFPGMLLQLDPGALDVPEFGCPADGCPGDTGVTKLMAVPELPHGVN